MSIDIYVPKVEVITPKPDHTGSTPGILTRVKVDGRDWSVVEYKVSCGSQGEQEVTLTFVADLTIGHSE